MKSMDEVINIIVDRSWDLLDAAVVQAREQDDGILLDENAREEYAETLRDKYKLMMKFMKPSVSSLDRHKVASIIIASIIETDAVTYNKTIPEDSSFFAKYMIAVSVGLSYMLERLNVRLNGKGIKEIERYWFPEAFSCATPYFDIFSRNLYLTHEHTDWKINLLDMPEILFFIEYFTLKENEIEPGVLTEEHVATE